MKTIITKKMIGEIISNWAKRQEEYVCVPGLPEHTHNDNNECIPLPKEWNLCNQCGRDTRIYHEYTKDCKDGICRENYPDEDRFKD